jgi:hypothetical protein
MTTHPEDTPIQVLKKIREYEGGAKKSGNS